MLKRNIAMYSALALLLVLSIVSAQRISSASVPVYVATASKPQLSTIIIDAGHGGIDRTLSLLRHMLNPL